LSIAFGRRDVHVQALRAFIAGMLPFSVAELEGRREGGQAGSAFPFGRQIDAVTHGTPDV